MQGKRYSFLFILILCIAFSACGKGPGTVSYSGEYRIYDADLGVISTGNGDGVMQAGERFRLGLLFNLDKGIIGKYRVSVISENSLLTVQNNGTSVFFNGNEGEIKLSNWGHSYGLEQESRDVFSLDLGENNFQVMPNLYLSEDARVYDEFELMIIFYESEGQEWTFLLKLTAGWETEPLEGSEIDIVTPLLNWNDVPGALGYQVKIALTHTDLLVAPVLDTPISEYQITLSDAVPWGETAFWQVRYTLDEENWSNWSSANSFSVKIYSIGDTGPGGGKVFYDKEYFSNGWRYLEAAPSDQARQIPWGGFNLLVGGTESGIGSGKANTERIVSILGSGNIAASICNDLVINDYDDWFLPSKEEMWKLLENRVAAGITGIYITSTDSCDYWTSTEYSSDEAIPTNFFWNSQYQRDKRSLNGIRAIRAF